MTIDQDIVVAKQDSLQFYVHVDSPIDMRQIQWIPKVEYRSTTEKAPDGTPISVRDAQGNALFELASPFLPTCTHRRARAQRRFGSHPE